VDEGTALGVGAAATAVSAGKGSDVDAMGAGVAASALCAVNVVKPAPRSKMPASALLPIFAFSRAVGM